ncbi:hypothetical protein RchiOBHm_Chr2g0093871 [Rosa chinensis]|uniref:Uncharacterized protein n=1 Tax=Rosa chinensis TaxID=74649 RepID=A0A2P6RKD3_ROSCH|nr:hypothetical protein RchiOBHm_Chr2g0093871 [Rosa chinensis]
MLLKAADKLHMTRRAFHLAFGRSSLFASSFDEVSTPCFTSCATWNFKCISTMIVIHVRMAP